MNKKALLVITLSILTFVPFMVLADNNTRQANREERQSDREERQADRKAEREANREERQSDRQEAFCQVFADRASEMASKYSERKSDITTKRQEWKDDRAQARSERDAKLAASRQEADTRREHMYDNLLNQAQTDEQKAAIAAFRAAVDAATTTRRAAVDQAMATFRSGVEALVAEKKNTTTTDLSRFETAMKEAVAEVESGCENGDDVATIRSNFQEAVKAARAKLQENRSIGGSDHGIGDEVRALAETRNASLKSAKETYQDSLKSARDALKAVFDSQSEGSDSVE